MYALQPFLVKPKITIAEILLSFRSTNST